MDTFPPPLPYPWSPDGNLCPVLATGEIWCDVFFQSDLRKLIKRACKRLHYGSQFLNSNDTTFGQAALWLLNRPKGRAEIHRQLTQFTHVDLPQLVYQTFYASRSEFRKLFSYKEVCDEQVSGQWFLDPERFGRQIAKTPAVREHSQSLALFACSFAMLEPAKGTVILSALLENCSECEPLVLTGQIPKLVSVESGTKEADELFDRDRKPKREIQTLETAYPPFTASATPSRTDPGRPASADPSRTDPELPAAADPTLTFDDELWTAAGLEQGGIVLLRFQEVYAALRERLKRMSSDIDNLPLTNEIDAETLSGLFEEMLDDLCSAALKAKAWLDSLNRSLTAGSACDSRHTLPLLETLHAHAAASHGTLDLLRKSSEEAGKLLLRIAGELSVMDNRHARDLDDIHRLDIELGTDEWAMPHPVPTGHLLRALALSPVMAERVAKRRQEFTDWLTNRKHELQHELDFRLNTYDLSALEPSFVERIETFRVNLAALATKSDFDAMRHEMTALNREFANHPQARGVVDLAREALSSAPRNLVPLAQALLAKDRAAEALTLLTLWQLCEDVEENAVEDFSALADTLLLAAVTLEAKRLLPFAWTDALFQQPWVRGLRRSDLGSLAIVRRLAVAMVVQDHLRGTQAEIGLFYQLDCASALGHDTYPTLSRMLEGIAVSRPLRIVASLPVFPKNEKAARIEKFFEPDQSSGGYQQQAAKRADLFHHMERNHLFPKLLEIWSDVRDLCNEGKWPAARKAAKLDAEDLLHQACQDASIGESTSSFYYRQVVSQQIGYIPALGQSLEKYVDACEQSVDIPRLEELVTTNAITDDLRRLAAADPTATLFWQITELALTHLPPPHYSKEISSGEELLAEWCHYSPGAVECCPEMVVALTRKAGTVRPEPETLRSTLMRLAEEHAESAFVVLQTGQCYRHLLLSPNVLAEGSGTSRAVLIRQEEVRLQLKECEETLQRRKAAVVNHPLTSLDATDWDYAMAHGCFAFLEELLETAEARVVGAVREQSDADLAWLRVHLKTLTEIKDAAEDKPDVSRDWLEDLLQLCDELERSLRQARAEIKDGGELGLPREPVENAVQTLQFILGEGTEDFSELQGYLQQLHPVKDEALAADVLSVEQPELMNPWVKLAAIDPVQDPFPVQRIWSELAKAFARACELYHGRDDNFQSARLGNYLWPYFKTGFYSPLNTWLNRKIHLCLCFGEKSEISELNRLRDKLENDLDAALNIVFVPSGLERLVRLWDYHPERSGYLIMDQVLLSKICARRDKPDVPLRQALHRSVENPTGIGLFKSEGYVHRRYNIFVGRTRALEQLAAQPASAIWGGRRTGKTSLMHALKSRLENANTLPAPHRVALIYADPDILDKVDPDITIARDIASKLKLPSDFQSIDEFQRLLQEACRQDCIAVLIDEADAYIINSRRVHGEVGFPLARVLRGLTQTDFARRFKLVYAGFKQLYYEVRMRETSETSYPFKQVLQPVQRDFKDLTFDETKALMTTGFVEMLGADIGGVPRLVHEKTGGHPAFVQRFCERLLTRLSAQRKNLLPLQLNAGDVIAVYNEETWERTDNASFLYYVHETLGWNVSHLGRAVLLALSVEIRADKSPEDRLFTAAQILRTLESWTPELPPPDKRDFDNTLELLTMTNMLTEKSSGLERHYKITYGAYIDFMNRLERIGQLEIQHSLAAHHKSEKGAIA